MSNNNSSTSNGTSLGVVLGVVFITLKLCHVIDWSWWWVTCPLWAPFALAAVVLAFAAICILIALICQRGK